jgi:hypothetical protein
MSDYDNSSRDELIKKIEEYEKRTDIVYTACKSYNQLEAMNDVLEEKLANAEEQRKKDIDELWTTRIIPLRKKVEEQDIKLSDVFKSDLHSFQRIKDLERTIEKQNAIISMAAGYISSTPQFSNTHPMDVMKWLMGGM